MTYNVFDETLNLAHSLTHCTCCCVMPTVLYCVYTAMAWNASMVRGRMPRQRQEWSNHVCSVGSRDPARDWHQQPTSPTEAASCHSGDGQHH